MIMGVVVVDVIGPRGSGRGWGEAQPVTHQTDRAEVQDRPTRWQRNRGAFRVGGDVVRAVRQCRGYRMTDRQITVSEAGELADLTKGLRRVPAAVVGAEQ